MKIIQSMRYKFWFFVLPIVVVIHTQSFGQTTAPLKPEKIEIDKYILITILTDFIKDAKENGGFYEDKGIINLTVCHPAEDGETKYSLQVLIDNRYEDRPILKYTYFNNYVVLFDSCRFELSIPDKGEYFRTLNDEIGDRVFKRPTKKGRWMTYRTKDGKVESGMKEVTEIRLGSGQHNERVYIVDDKNKFRKFSTL